jgi:hypothetical protein
MHFLAQAGLSAKKSCLQPLPHENRPYAGECAYATNPLKKGYALRKALIIPAQQLMLA